MFETIKNWLRSPLDPDCWFGYHIKKAYQTLFPLKTKSKEDSLSELLEYIHINHKTRKPSIKSTEFDFLDSILMDLRTRQCSVFADSNLIINHKQIIEDYDTLIACMVKIIEKMVVSQHPTQHMIKSIKVWSWGINDKTRKRH